MDKLSVSQDSLALLKQGYESLMKQRAELESNIHAQRGAIALMESLLESANEAQPATIDAEPTQEETPSL